MSQHVIKIRATKSMSKLSKLTKEVHSASLQAKDILASARAQAADLLETARLENEQKLADSAERGYAAGLERWNETLADAWKQREDFLAKNEAEFVKLAVAIAKKIIGESTRVDPDIVLQIVRDALRSVRSERKVTIKVNPSDEALLRLKAESLTMLGSEVGELIVVANPSITAGGCVVESDLGIIDAQIDTQLASIERSLLRRFDVSNQ
jgi:type III secretion system HrpE/YscL family protein